MGDYAAVMGGEHNGLRGVAEKVTPDYVSHCLEQSCAVNVPPRAGGQKLAQLQSYLTLSVPSVAIATAVLRLRSQTVSLSAVRSAVFRGSGGCRRSPFSHHARSCSRRGKTWSCPQWPSCSLTLRSMALCSFGLRILLQAQARQPASGYALRGFAACTASAFPGLILYI